jgi:hypothetical protein
MKVTRLFVGANVVAAGDVERMRALVEQYAPFFHVHRVVKMLRTRY